MHIIYVSGQPPALPDGTLVTGSIAERTAACIRNIDAILGAHKSSLKKVIKTTVFLTDMAHFAEMDAEYGRWFKWEKKPARSCVAVHQLRSGVEVEIECVAEAGAFFIE